MLRERQENMDKQFNDLRKLYNKKWEVPQRDRKHKKNEIGSLELNTITELKSPIQSFNRRAGQARHSISEE